MLTFIFSVFTMTEYNKSSGSFLSSAVVTAYMYWLLFSAMMSNPDTECNAYSSSNDVLQIVLGLILGAASITYAGYSLANSGSLWGNTEEEEKAESLAPPADVETGDKDAAAKAEAAEHAKDIKREQAEANSLENRVAEVAEDKRNSKFHFFMATTAMYMAMLLTSWGSNMKTVDIQKAELNEMSMWIKIVTQWMTGLLYMWVLVAPSVLANREF